MRFSQSTIVAIAALLPLTFAQTSTDCNPLEKTCPADTGLNAATFSADFTKGESASFSAAEGTTLTYGSTGAQFKISSYGQAPTLQSNFYFLFGKVDIVAQAAPGVGVISSVVLESDDLDEIDWEWLGGDTTQVQSNYFGKGNTTTYDRAIYHTVSSPQTTFHTYTIDWNADRCIFSIDGTAVRTLNYKDANGGTNYPQTPMRLKLGNWTPSKDATGTIEWAGGPVDWSAAPFSMYVKSVSIQNYNPADSYEYGDKTGSWQSIKIINGTSSGSSSASTTATASAVGTGTLRSGSITATSAPTSMLPVANITATVGPSAANATKTSSPGAATVAPSGFTSSAIAPSVVGSSSASPSSTASPPSQNAASSVGMGMACSVLSLAAAFLLL